MREAVHRLKQYELVRVHQGNRTLVLDPARATNVNLLGLESEVISQDSDWLASFAKRQLYSAAALLALAEQRIEPPQLERLETIAQRLAELPASCPSSDRFEQVRMYWRVRDTEWHFERLERHPHLCEALSWPPECLTVVHRRLNAKLGEGRGSATAYLEMVRNLRSRVTAIVEPAAEAASFRSVPREKPGANHEVVLGSR